MNPEAHVKILGHAFTVRDLLWQLVGFLGQGLFFSRFVVQWLASEKAGKSVIPVAFWYFSIVGGVITLVYAWWGEHSLPFAIGQVVGMFVYSRNLALIRREKQNGKNVPDTSGGGSQDA